MKFPDSTFNGLKVTVGTKKCDPPTHARSKSNMPHQVFQSLGHNEHTSGNKYTPVAINARFSKIAHNGNCDWWIPGLLNCLSQLTEHCISLQNGF